MNLPLRILVCNDDGYFAPGISALAAALQSLGEIVVVAPERNCSGASNSLTLDRPLNVQRSQAGFLYVNGTPTDCVHIAVTGLFKDRRPDIVVSGINCGANMGDDTIYSGTVAAATEGFLLGIPSFAFSLVDPKMNHLESAAKVAYDVVSRFIADPMPSPLLLNVNIPDLPYEQLQDTVCTRLGKRHRSEPVYTSTNPRGEPIYWIGPAGPASDAGVGTDFYAVANGKVSITPLQIDLTRTDQLPLISDWLKSTIGLR